MTIWQISPDTATGLKSLTLFFSLQTLFGCEGELGHTYSSAVGVCSFTKPLISSVLGENHFHEALGRISETGQ